MTKLASSLFAVALLFLVSCSDPEDKLQNHFENIEAIMTDNMEDPEQGVDKIISYFEANGAEMSELHTTLVISIASIEKDGDREARIKELSEELETSNKNFKGTAEKFEKALSDNKEAKEKMQDFSKRMGEASRASITGNPLFFMF